MTTSRTLFLFLIAPAVVSVCIYGPTAVYQGVLATVDGVYPYDSSTITDVISSMRHTQTYIYISFLLIVALLTVLMYYGHIAYNFIVKPCKYYGNEAEVAYKSKKIPPGIKENTIQDMKRARKFGKIPPVYPNGWFAVLRSDEVKMGETKSVHVLGMTLAVFRGESGQSYIVDAYCPHLGANLGVGGTVDGDCIACPFHGWTFRGDDGKCVKIAYADKVPEFCKVKTHRSLEINHLIMIWHHAEGEEPSWFPPEIEEIKNGKWMYHGFCTAYFNCHVQDVSENHGDPQHLHYVHAPQIPLKGAFYNKTDWNIHPTEKHINVSLMELQADKPLWSQKKFSTTWYSEQIGPGLNYLNELVDGVKNHHIFILTTIPVGPMRQKNMTVGYSGKGIFSRIKSKILIHNFLEVVGHDIPIWANKTYQSKPIFVKEDHCISKHRRWYSQFYSENSPRYNPNDSMEW